MSTRFAAGIGTLIRRTWKEPAVAEGIRRSGLDRKDVFLTGKVWNNHQGYESTLTSAADSLKRLKVATRDEKIVALGDKLSNMRAIARDYTSEGEVFWDRFRIKEKSVHGWRYHALLDALSDLSDTYAYQEFEFLVNRIFPAD